MTYGNYFAWLPYYIFNRMASATVTPAGGSPVTLSSTVDYDASCGGYYMTSTNATYNHDPAYTATGGRPRRPR